MHYHFLAIFDKAPEDQILRTFARGKPAEIAAEAEELTDDQIQFIGNFTCQKILHCSSAAALKVGGFLYIAHAAMNRAEHAGGFSDLCRTVGTSETRGYVKMKNFKRFGKPLLEEPELIPRFSIDAMEKLSADYAPEQATQAAIQAARRGERITGDRADEILTEYGVFDTPESQTEADAHDEPSAELSPKFQPSLGVPKKKSARRRTSRKQVYVFSEDTTRVVIQAQKSRSMTLHEIELLVQAALDDIHKLIVETDNKAASNDQAVDEEAPDDV